VQDINKLMKQFEQMQKMMKSIGKPGGAGRLMHGRRMPAGF
jgi:signal recognition particle GTPase